MSSAPADLAAPAQAAPTGAHSNSDKGEEADSLVATLPPPPVEPFRRPPPLALLARAVEVMLLDQAAAAKAPAYAAPARAGPERQVVPAAVAETVAVICGEGE